MLIRIFDIKDDLDKWKKSFVVMIGGSFKSDPVNAAPKELGFEQIADTAITIGDATSNGFELAFGVLALNQNRNADRRTALGCIKNMGGQSAHNILRISADDLWFAGTNAAKLSAHLLSCQSCLQRAYLEKQPLFHKCAR